MNIRSYFPTLRYTPFLGSLGWFLVGGGFLCLLSNGHALPGANAQCLATLTGSLPITNLACPLLGELGCLLGSAQALNYLAAGLGGCILALLFYIIQTVLYRIIENSPNFEQSTKLSQITAHGACAFLFLSLTWLLGATHLTNTLWQTNCLMIVLALITWITGVVHHRRILMFCSAILCGIFVLESVFCLILLPIVTAYFTWDSWKTHNHSISIARYWGVGLLLGVTCIYFMQGSWAGGENIGAYTKTFIQSLKIEILQWQGCFPQAWLFHIIGTLTWSILAIATGVFAMKGIRNLNLMIILTALIIVFIGQSFEMPYSVWQLWIGRGELAINSAILIAVGTAFLMTSLFTQSQSPRSLDNKLRRINKVSIFVQLHARYILFPIFLLCVAFSGIRTWNYYFHTDQSLADDYADEITSRLNGRVFFLGAPWLDAHLALSAKRNNIPLHLFVPYLYKDRTTLNALRHVIKTAPELEGSDRERALCLLDANFIAFIRDFFVIQKHADQIVATLNLTDLWQSAQQSPRPMCTFFAGGKTLRQETPEALENIIAEHNAFNKSWIDRVKVDASKEDDQWDMMNTMRILLARQLSLINNNLGAYLADANQNVPSFAAYKTALTYDSENISTLFNLYDLVINRGQHKEFQLEISTRFQAFLQKYRQHKMTFDLSRIGHIYGTIRNNELFSAMGISWAMQTAPESTLAGLHETQDALSKDDPNRHVMKAILSSVYEQQGDIEHSEAGYLEAFNANTKNIFALQGALRLTLKRKDLDAYKALLLKAEKENVPAEQLDISWATYHLQQKAYTKAQAKIEYYLITSPDDCSALLTLATTELAQNNFKQVRRYTMPKLKAVAKGDNLYYVHLLNGHLILAEDKEQATPKAINYYRQALDLKPDAVELLEVIIRLNLAINEIESIEFDALSLLSRVPNHPLANSLVGAKRLANGDPKTALLYLDKAITLQNPDSILLNNYADALIYLGRYTEAVVAAQRAIAANKSFFAPHGTLAMAYARLNQLDKAKQALIQARKLPGGDHPLLFLVDGWIALQENNLEQAQACINKLLNSFTLSNIDTLAIEQLRTAIKAASH